MAASMPASKPQVRVGVAAVIIGDDGLTILGRRKGSLGAGQWGFPGGHLEFGESYFHCAERETLEETGLKVKALNVLAVTNTIFDSEHHYITLFIRCRQEDSRDQPQVLEPEKCHAWVRMSWGQIESTRANNQEELFLPIVNLLRENPGLERLIDEQPTEVWKTG